MTTAKMRVVLVSILLVCLVHLSSGCVFDDDHDDDCFYKRNPRTADFRKLKRQLFMELDPSYKCNAALLKSTVDLTAGPFSIDNVNVTSAKYNHNDQGADWPSAFANCGGLSQSPIDISIKSCKKNSYPALKFTNYTNFHPNMSIINNGHSLDIVGPWGLIYDVYPEMSGGPLNGTYRLVGLHFHWGYNSSHGSEHSFDSDHGSLELHFVHYSKRYANVSEALNASNDPESLAVVGYIFNLKRQTSTEAKGIFESLCKALESGFVFPAFMPLAMISTSKHYYTYQGALTVPSCNEKVRWIVMRKQLDISEEHLSLFSKLMVNGDPILGNYRETQPLNGRIVYKSF